MYSRFLGKDDLLGVGPPSKKASYHIVGQYNTVEHSILSDTDTLGLLREKIGKDKAREIYYIKN